MSLRFLCPRYRRWLLHAPDRAPAFWRAGMEAAQSLAARGQWHAAVPHAGNAFEAAQVMVTDPRHCTQDWLRRHAASRELLKLASDMLSLQGVSTRVVH